MRISIITIGTKMPAWVSQGVEEYSKRMPRELKVEWKELPLAQRGKGASAAKFTRDFQDFRCHRWLRDALNGNHGHGFPECFVGCFR